MKYFKMAVFSVWLVTLFMSGLTHLFVSSILGGWFAGTLLTDILKDFSIIKQEKK